MRSETVLLLVGWGPWALAAGAVLAFLAWGVWPQITAAWARAGLPRLTITWPEPEQPEVEAPAPPIDLPVVWPYLTEHDIPDHLKEAA